MDWDETLFRIINGMAGQSALLDGVMIQLGLPGQLVLPIVLALVYWVWQARGEAVIGAPTLAVLIIVADFLGARLKYLIARPRPCQALPSVQEVVGCGGSFSFPSNHALNTVTAAAFFQVLYPSTGWISWPLVALVGVSRVYTGGHYVTDVLGGWMIGGLFGVSSALLLLHFAGERFKREHASTAGP